MVRISKKKRGSVKIKPTQRSVPIARYYKSTSASTKKSTSKIDSSGKPKKGAATKLKLFFINLPQRILIFAIVALLFINTTISSARVKMQESSNTNQYRAVEEYRTNIEGIIGESLLNKSKLTLSSSKIESQIRDMFPEVTSATVVVPIAGRVLQVGLRLDHSMLRLRRQDSQQGIVGKSGRLLILTDTNKVLESFSTLPGIILDPNVEFAPGDQVLTSVEAELLSLLMSEFDGSEQHRYKPLSILFQVERRELQVNFEGVPFYAKLTPERDPRIQVGALLATLKELTRQGSLPSTYIDTRVEDRVFVK